MYAIDFEYDGKRLCDYQMIICSYDGASGVESVSSGADISFSQVKPANSDYFNLYSSTYDAPYTATFQIGKNICYFEDQEDMYLTPVEISGLQRWLCRRNEYHKFKIDQEGYRNIYWNGTFSSKQVEIGGRVVGLELTLTTDAGYAYLEIDPIEIECKAGETFSIYDISDKVGYIRPNMEIEILQNATNFKLSNLMDNKIMEIKNVKRGEVITLDGKNQVITSSLTSGEDLAKNFNYFFPKIINTLETNKNDFTTSLDCRIKINYSPIRMVGL